MILYLEINKFPGIDVYSFFPQNNAIVCPKEVWLESIYSSLRSKQEVLILEAPVSPLPVCDKSRRWDYSANWCWLAPRGLSALKANLDTSTTDFRMFKTFLTSSK
jgi:hypothetical protein